MSEGTEQAAPVEEQAAPVADVVETPAAQPVEEAVVERAVEDDTLEIPDSSQPGGKIRYVPGSALVGARTEISELKKSLAEAKVGSERAQQLEARIDELSQQLANIAPKAQAYDAALAAQQMQPQIAAQEDADAADFAKSLQLYSPDGTPDVSTAKKLLAAIDKRAEQKAQAQVAPFAAHTVRSQSDVMYARAKATLAELGVNVPEGTLNAVWRGVDPSLAATPDGARWLVTAAVGAAVLGEKVAARGTARTPTGQFAPAQPRQEIPAPLHTERAGGRDTPDHLPLSAAEKAYCKDVGMSEKDYLAATPQWSRR